MYIKQLRIKNFRGYGENPNSRDGFFTFDDLDKDFVVLSGFNGFGKTSFVEAIEWCITDEVQRLKNIESVYDVRDLKKSYYLKYYHPKLEVQTNRQIIVEILLSNGLTITRSSNSQCPKMKSKQDQYTSNLNLSINGEPLLVQDEDTLLSFFLEDKSISQFLNTHILGQENINSFLRSNTPSDRRSIFLQLLNMTPLDDMYQETLKLRNGRGFSNKKKDTNIQIQTLEQKLTSINNFFSMYNFVGMNEYINAINYRHKKTKELIVEQPSMSEISKLILMYNELITPSTCIGYLKNVEKVKSLLSAKKAELDKKLESAQLLNDYIEKYRVLDQGLAMLRKLEQAEALKEIDYSKIIHDISDVSNYLKTLSEREESLKKKADILQNYSSIFTRLVELSNGNASLEVDYWDTLKLTEDKYILFINNFKEEEYAINPEKSLKAIASLKVLREKYEVDSKMISDIKANLEYKQEELNSMTKINASYAKVLESVKFYIAENSNISECPICLNSEFGENKYKVILNADLNGSVRDKLLAIIDSTISVGNDSIGKVSSEISKIQISLSAFLLKFQNEVLSVVASNSRFINENFNTQFERIASDITVTRSRIIQELKFSQEKLKTLTDTKTRYEECLNYIFGNVVLSDVPAELVLETIDKISHHLDSWYADVLERQLFSFKPSKSEVNDELAIIQNKKGFSEYYPDKIKQLNADIEDLRRTINRYNQISTLIDDTLVLKVPNDCSDMFANYATLDQNINVLNQRLDKLNKYEGAIKLINSNASATQQSIVETKLKKHPIISWIYESINPHPFYKKLIITSDNNGANFKSENEGVYLDHLFSSAQLNVLALSVFLGLGLTQDFSKLDQLVLDDPIQSMDDVNILAFIDVLRGILDMENRKKIIISTHDGNFADLLSIKFRNKEYIHYNFTSYGMEGPVYKKFVNGILQ